MDKNFLERGLEEIFMGWLDDLNWETLSGKGFDKKFNREKNEIIYWGLLKDKLKEINEELDETNIDDFISSLKRDLNFQNLLEGNKEFLRIIRKGKAFTISENGQDKRKYMNLIEFQNIESNSFLAVNQFNYRGNQTIILDIVLFVNGIPLVVGELKSEAQGGNTYVDGIEDINKYEEIASKLFVTNLLNFASDAEDFRYGATKATEDQYYPWRESIDYEDIEYETKKAVYSIFNHATLLDILQYYVFFGNKGGENVKIIPRYMQYNASIKIIDRIRGANHKRGLIWHTQGSGKSYTMLFSAFKIQKTHPITSPIILILVDRANLNKQMKQDLSNIGFPNYEVAEGGENLEEILSSGASKTIVSTIQKFENVEKQIVQDNIIIFSDEAHRFMEKKLGNKLEYCLPNAYNFGFTGTPVRESDRDTFKNFMPKDKEETYLHRYSISQGLKDQLILPVYFEIKDIEWDISTDKLRELDIEFETKFEDMSIEKKDEILRKYVNKSDLAEIRPRVRRITKAISDHYDQKHGEDDYKAMVVTPSRRAAAIYKEEMDKNRLPSESEVIYSPPLKASDEIVSQYTKSEEEIDKIVKDFSDPDKKPNILIVCSMLLTGFDAPILKTMYLDRGLKNHSLLQAIARTNRPRPGKNNGLIVDFMRVFENLDESLNYDDEVKYNAAFNNEKLKEEFRKVLNELVSIFDKASQKEGNIHDYVAFLGKFPETRKEFIIKYKKLQDLYETISPDKFLAKPEIEKEYRFISKIYVTFRKKHRREEKPEAHLQNRTKKLLDEHMDIEGIKEEFPIYKISYEHLESIKDLKPEAKAAEIKYAIQFHIKENSGKNPRYVKISERIKEIANRWQKGEIEDQIAAEKLEAEEKKLIELDKAPNKMGMTEAEYAIFTVLEEEYEDYVVNKEEAISISSDIWGAFKEIDTDFEGWDQNENIKNKIRASIIQVLAKHNKLSGDEDSESLYNTDFIKEAIEYIINNER